MVGWGGGDGREEFRTGKNRGIKAFTHSEKIHIGIKFDLSVYYGTH